VVGFYVALPLAFGLYVWSLHGGDPRLESYTGWQIFVTVHNRLWRDQVSTVLRKHNSQVAHFHIDRWTFSDGPSVAGRNPNPARGLEYAMQSADSVAICAEAGRLAETLSDRLSIAFGISVRRREGDSHTLGDTWTGVLKALRQTALSERRPNWTAGFTSETWLGRTRMIGRPHWRMPTRSNSAALPPRFLLLSTVRSAALRFPKRPGTGLPGCTPFGSGCALTPRGGGVVAQSRRIGLGDHRMQEARRGRGQGGLNAA
jgi:hypothetical protein